MKIPTKSKTVAEVFIVGCGIVGMLWLTWALPIAAQLMTTFSLLFILAILVADTMGYLKDE